MTLKMTRKNAYTKCLHKMTTQDDYTKCLHNMATQSACGQNAGRQNAFCRVGTETNYFREFKVYICYDGTLSVLP